MAKFTEHRPGFVSGFENHSYEFETKEELLDIEYIKQWANDSEFHRFSIRKDYSDVPGKEHVLIAEIDKGQEWWRVGYISQTEVVNEFPKWVAKRESK